MNKKNKFIPNSLDEIVIPVGKAKLLTTQENIDEAMEIASRIFAKEIQENDVHEICNTALDIEDLKEEKVMESKDLEEIELTVLTDEELAILPTAKYGRDKYGRALNKNGTPRKGRNDKGTKRGSYGPRSIETES